MLELLLINLEPKSRQNPSRCANLDKGIPFDPCVISAHRGGGISGGILARGHFEKGTKVASLGCCRPHEFAAHICVLRSKLTANSRSTLATAPHRQRARRRATRAPNHRHYPSASRRDTPHRTRRSAWYPRTRASPSTTRPAAVRMRRPHHFAVGGPTVADASVAATPPRRRLRRRLPKTDGRDRPRVPRRQAHGRLDARRRAHEQRPRVSVTRRRGRRHVSKTVGLPPVRDDVS